MAGEAIGALLSMRRLVVGLVVVVMSCGFSSTTFGRESVLFYVTDNMASHSVAFIPGDESVIVIGDGELSILRRRLQAALKRLEELKFVTKVDSEEEAWEVRRILKARFPIEDIEALRERLQAFEQERS